MDLRDRGDLCEVHRVRAVRKRSFSHGSFLLEITVPVCRTYNTNNSLTLHVSIDIVSACWSVEVAK